MDFWGVEVKGGEPCAVEPGEGRFTHLSQACLGEVKENKGSESIYLYVTVDGKKLILGTLSHQKFPQKQFDLVFDRHFELSHNLKNGSVFFYGYRCNNPFNEPEDDSEEDLLVNVADDEQKAMIVEPKKDVKTIEDDDGSIVEEDTSPSSDFLTETESDDFDDTESESLEGETDDSDEDEEAPKKVEPSKKRPAESATNTPVPAKKAKLVTPKKTDAHKGSVHVDTPHPSKKAGKIPDKSNQQTPKSAGSQPCKTCKRSFNSENALLSHTKAKHSNGK